MTCEPARALALGVELPEDLFVAGNARTGNGQLVRVTPADEGRALEVSVWTQRGWQHLLDIDAADEESERVAAGVGALLAQLAAQQ